MKIHDLGRAKNISGSRIRKARTVMRLSQSDLAARLQVNGVAIDQQTISKIEIGKRSVTDYELLMFAKVLSVSVSWLVGSSPIELQ